MVDQPPSDALAAPLLPAAQPPGAPPGVTERSLQILRTDIEEKFKSLSNQFRWGGAALTILFGLALFVTRGCGTDSPAPTTTGSPVDLQTRVGEMKVREFLEASAELSKGLEVLETALDKRLKPLKDELDRQQETLKSIAEATGAKP